MKTKSNYLKLNYESGLGSFLDEISFNYEFKTGCDVGVVVYIYFAQTPTYEEVWFLAQEFAEWKQKNLIY